MAAAPEGSDAGADRALLVVSLAVLLASATWFSGTAVVPTLRVAWGLGDGQSAALTTAVQLGFIAGTFVYGVLNVPDLFGPRAVFFASALAGGALNGAFAAFSNGWPSAVALRFLTGVTLAGVYPVGMKIVASWFQSGLGWRLGVMVGALTLGTASPYLVRAAGTGAHWRVLTAVASASAVAGGALMLLGVGDGPYLRARARFDPRAAFAVFRDPAFRLNAFGYFGHMWELYAVWSLLAFYVSSAPALVAAGAAAVPLLGFLTVGAGAVGCVAGGWLSRRVGERRVALLALCGSAACCVVSGLAWALPLSGLSAFLLLWGIVIVADSPQFSALAARYCPPEYTGTALTVQNGVGFAVTVASIQLVPVLAGWMGWRWAFAALALGPLAGAVAMARLGRVAD